MKTDFLKYIIITALFITAACDNSESDEQSSESPESDIITLSKEQFEKSEMRFGSFKNHSFKNRLKVTGKIVAAPQNIADVNVFYGGKVLKMKLMPGESVNKGQFLFSLQNPEFAELRKNYLASKQSLKLYEGEYLRNKKLFADSIISRKSMTEIETRYLNEKSKAKALEQKLISLNIRPEKLNADNISDKISVQSPVSGYLFDLKIRPGMFLEAGQNALSVINTDELFLNCTVFEKDFSKLKIGQNINFKLPEDKKCFFNAELVRILPVLDEESSTAEIYARIIADSLSSSSQLKPGMYIEAGIETENIEAKALSNEAIVESEDKHYIISLKTQDKQNYYFEQKEVKIGRKENRLSEILNADNFSENTKILIKGAYFLVE